MSKDFIHFFGTTGNKDVFFNKLRSAGGMYFNVDDTKIIIDPGPTTFYKYLNNYNNVIDGIILSHIHIDHSNDLNIFVELMSKGGEEKQGTLLVPNQAVEEKVLLPYLKDFPKQLEILKSCNKYVIKNIEINCSIEHKHGVETYGFKIKTKNYIIGLITDTAFFPELLNFYIGSDILIINVPYYKQDKPKPKHLDVANVEEFIKVVKPKKVILTHFNSNIINNNPVTIAKNLSKKYGIEVISAEDDMIVSL